MRTAEEIAAKIVDELDTWPTPLRRYAEETPWVMQDVAAIIRAARIEAVEMKCAPWGIPNSRTGSAN